MDVIIYGRVSTQIQDYERQINELKRFAVAFEYNVVKVFSEVISGAKTGRERKEITNLIKYIDENSNIDGVLISELSRLGRDTSDVLNNINKLNERKVWLYSKHENIYTLNPKDKTPNSNAELTLTILSGIASYERKTIVQRSISGLRNTTIKGNWVGGAFLPYGYKREDKKLLINEEEKKIIERIYNLFLKGNGTKRIANILNKEKVPTRYNLSLQKDEIKINGRIIKREEFKWKDGTIYGILTNETYIGKKNGKNNLEGIILKSPKIIDDEIFEKVQQELKSKRIKHKTKFFYLFQNKLNCGRCGRSYYPHKRASKDPKKVSKDSRYICLSKRYNVSCDNIGIGISKINDGVWSVLRNNRAEINNIIKLNSANIETLNKTLRERKEEQSGTEKKLKNLLKREEDLVQKSLNNEISKEVYSKLWNNIKQEREEIDETLNIIKDEIALTERILQKQSNTNLQLRNIKENKRILKNTIDEVVDRINIYPIFKHNLENYIKINKQDKFVFVEIYTYLNNRKPLVFVVSQRSKNIITPRIEEFNKTTCTLKISSQRIALPIRELYHLYILD